MVNIEELIQKISQHTDLSKAEIKLKIEQKKEELEHLINDIAAAHIIAKDYEVPLGRPEGKKSPELTIKSLKQMEPGLSGVSITGIILRVYHPIEFTREGGKNLLAPILFHDGTESIRMILWGTKARQITGKQIARGSIVQIKQGYTKLGRTGNLELHLGDRGMINVVADAETDKYPNPEDEITDVDIINEELFEVDLKAVVIRLGKLVTFNRADGTEGRVANIYIKGNQVTRRMVFWDDRAEEAFNFTRGDEILIQGAKSKIDREGKAEIHSTRSTYVVKIGQQSLPPLEEHTQQEGTIQTSTMKNIEKISSNDEYVSVTVKKGPVSSIREFTRKDGSIGSVGRASLFDNTGVITLVLWNGANHEFEAFKDQSIKIENLRVTMSKFQTLELHTSRNTSFTEDEGAQLNGIPTMQEISQLDPERGLACIQGILQNITEIREFTRADGSTGRVASLTLEDKTGTTRIVAWNDHVTKLDTIDSETTNLVKVLFGGIRKDREGGMELHLNTQSEVHGYTEIPPEFQGIEIKQHAISSGYNQIDYIKTHLAELPSEADGETIEVVGKVIRLFQQTPYYWGCPECRKKVTQVEDGEDWICREHDNVDPIIRLRLSGLLDDGTATIKATFFGISGEILTSLKSSDVSKMIEDGMTDDQIFEEMQTVAEGKTIKIQGRVQLRTQEVQEETVQQQELYVNQIRFPSAVALSEELLTELEG